MCRIEYEQDSRWQQQPGDYPTLAAAKRIARAGAAGRHWRVVSIPDAAMMSAWMRGIRAVNSPAQQETSAKNGAQPVKPGSRPRGRPKGKKERKS